MQERNLCEFKSLQENLILKEPKVEKEKVIGDFKSLKEPPILKEPGENKPEKERTIGEFLEATTYTLEKYTPNKNSLNEEKNPNKPNQLPKPLDFRFISHHNTHKRAVVSFKKTNLANGDSTLLHEDEEKTELNNYSPLKVIDSHNLHSKAKSFQSKLSSDIPFNNEPVSVVKKSTHHMNKISFELNFDNLNFGFNRSQQLLYSSNSSLKSFCGNNQKIEKFQLCSQDDFLNNFATKAEYYDLFFEALALCHSAEIGDEGEIKSNFPEDIVILKFLETFGYKFEKKGVRNEVFEAYIRVNQRRMAFNVYYTSGFDLKQRHLVVLYQDPKNSDQAILLSRGTLKIMKKKIIATNEDLNNLELSIKEFYKKGIIPLIYARKTISIFETKDLLEKLNIFKSSPINYEEEINSLLSEQEKELSFLGIIGLKDKLTPGIKTTMSFWKSLGVGIWVVSGDCRENCLLTATSAGFIDFKEEFYELESENKSQLLLNMKTHLEDIKDLNTSISAKKNYVDRAGSIMKNSRKSITNFFRLMTKTNQHSIDGVTYIQNNKYLLLNGKSLKIILDDEYLKLNFLFLVSLVKRFVCYGLTPEQKGQLCELVQKKIQTKKIKTLVMAIGDGWNDALMLQKASIGLEFIQKQGILNAGDIQFNDFQTIKPLMIDEGIVKVVIYEQLLLYLYYKGVLMFCPIFLFNWHCNFTATEFFPLSFPYYLDFVFTFHNIIVFFLFEEPLTINLLAKYPCFYKDFRFTKRQLILRFLLGSYFEGLLHGIFIFYSCFYTCSEAIGPDGNMFDLNVSKTLVALSLNFVGFIRIFMDTQTKKSKLIMSICPMTLVLTFFFMFIPQICDIFVCANSFMRLSLGELLSKTPLMICFLGNIIFAITIHYLVINIVFRKLAGSWAQIFMSVSKNKQKNILDYLQRNSQYIS